jgi:sugar lactone lactonase YvrE
MHQPSVVLDSLGFPEGPRWHDGELWFSDFVAKAVRSTTLDGEIRSRAMLDDQPSGIGFLPDATPVVVSSRKKQVVRIDEGTVAVHADLQDLPGDYLNDMLADGDGRLYVGHRSAALRPHRLPLPASSACDRITIVEPDGTVRVGAVDVMTPNGTVLTPDGRTLIVAETYAQRLMAFARLSDGSLGERTVFAEVPGRYPDGICLDDTGAVWVSSPYTGEFIRVREGGAIADHIAMPGGVACALGGPDRRTLFLLAVAPKLLPPVEGLTPPDGDDAANQLPGRIATVPVNDAAAGWQ